MATVPLATYSVKHCAAVWGTLSLWDETDTEGGVSIEAQADAWRLIGGCDGELERVRRSNFPGTAFISLPQSTEACRNLLVRLTADAVTGVVVAPFAIYDRMSGTGFSSPLAYLRGLPKYTFAGSTQVVVWALELASLVPIPAPGLATGAPR